MRRAEVRIPVRGQRLRLVFAPRRRRATRQRKRERQPYQHEPGFYHAAIVRMNFADSRCFAGGRKLVCHSFLGHTWPEQFNHLKILVAITGASGSLYAQRLLDNLDPSQHEIHVVHEQLRATGHRDGAARRLEISGGREAARVEKHERPLRQRLESAGRDGGDSLHDGHAGAHRPRLQRGCAAPRCGRGAEREAQTHPRPARNAAEPRSCEEF
jgi:hypothetical protein